MNILISILTFILWILNWGFLIAFCSMKNNKIYSTLTIVGISLSIITLTCLMIFDWHPEFYNQPLNIIFNDIFGYLLPIAVIAFFLFVALLKAEGLSCLCYSFAAYLVLSAYLFFTVPSNFEVYPKELGPFKGYLLEDISNGETGEVWEYNREVKVYLTQEDKDLFYISHCVDRENNVYNVPDFVQDDVIADNLKNGAAFEFESEYNGLQVYNTLVIYDVNLNKTVKQ